MNNQKEIKKLNEQIEILQEKINSISIMIDDINKEKFKILTEIKLQSDEIICSY